MFANVNACPGEQAEGSRRACRSFSCAGRPERFIGDIQGNHDLEAAT